MRWHYCLTDPSYIHACIYLPGQSPTDPYSYVSISSILHLRCTPSQFQVVSLVFLKILYDLLVHERHSFRAGCGWHSLCCLCGQWARNECLSIIMPFTIPSRRPWKVISLFNFSHCVGKVRWACYNLNKEGNQTIRYEHFEITWLPVQSD
jgi:hypothetical protein